MFWLLTDWLTAGVSEGGWEWGSEWLWTDFISSFLISSFLFSQEWDFEILRFSRFCRFWILNLWDLRFEIWDLRFEIYNDVTSLSSSLSRPESMFKNKSMFKLRNCQIVRNPKSKLEFLNSLTSSFSRFLVFSFFAHQFLSFSVLVYRFAVAVAVLRSLFAGFMVS